MNAGINLFGNKSCVVELKLYDQRSNVVSRTRARFEPNEEGKLKIDVSGLFTTVIVDSVRSLFRNMF